MRVITAVLLVLGPAAQDDDREDRVDIYAEVEETFIKKWAAAEASGSAKELLRLYDIAFEKYPNKLIQPDPGVKRWIRVPLHLAAKIAGLPDREIEAREIVARQVFETVLEPAARRKAIEKYAFTQAGRDALQQMANLDCDSGRLNDAVRAWARAVDARPTADIVARLAHAHALRGDSAALLALHALAESRGLEGAVTVAGRKRQLQEYLDTVKPAGVAAPLLKPAPPGPTNEIPLGRLEFPDGPWGRGLATSLPAAGRVNGKDLVVTSNGNTVFAIDPARAEGGRLDDAVEWRYPQERGVRTYLSAYQTASLGTALPYVGATVAGNRAYVTMFTRMDQKPEQVGRRSEKFEGPAALRAFNLANGELLWDTETLEIERNGVKVRMMEHLKFDLLNFCFGGPPLIRGDRLYAAVMKSPLTPRRCYALCLDARTGDLIWHQELGGVPPTRGTASIVSLAEEEGTLVVATNFGIVAALDSESGEFEWTVKVGTPDLYRTAASPPVIAGSQVYVLPQNNRELVAFDRWTGRATPLPALSQEVPWESVSHLVGRAGEWLVFSGSRNVAIRATDGEVVKLIDGEEERRGRGAIAGGLVYLPTRSALQIFDAGTWKLRDAVPWPENREAGNIVVTDAFCLHVADRLDIYTSAPILMKRFVPKVEATPPRPEACRQLGLLLEGGGRMRDAARYYRRALKVWENDPVWQETADGLRKRLADIAAKLGEESKDE